MKTTQRHRRVHCALLAGLLGSLGAISSSGQFTFNSGSDGHHLALNVTSSTTLTLPADGKFHYTTITVASNVILSFTTNTLNTPVYLLATGDIIINGTINVSGVSGTTTAGGAGGPGGFAGGNPVSAGLATSDGRGPGAGQRGTSDSSNSTNSAGYASYGTAATGTTAGNGATYGSPLLVPLIGGSGGGGRPSRGGTGGGGAILIASSSSVVIRGAINARGGNYSTGDGIGSGGAIRLLAPVISGNGTLDVSSVGHGRIRVDCMDRRFLALTYTPSSVASIGANMVTIPANLPRLDITQVAGNNIVVGTGAPVFFMLPQGSSTNQTVTVQASGFNAPVPISVVLTPDNGPGLSYPAEIDNSTVNPASVTVPVVVPANVQVQVNAWTR